MTINAEFRVLLHDLFKRLDFVKNHQVELRQGIDEEFAVALAAAVKAADGGSAPAELYQQLIEIRRKRLAAIKPARLLKVASDLRAALKSLDQAERLSVPTTVHAR
ncbi:hypothetical protein [Solimonas aquatica]|uniref:hypothetical protein n=1 Tax=Solimonas aquatica TaxID=489703 RepID=UPI00116024A7|nr:hypothetical protein [Solimonas aquatica]